MGLLGAGQWAASCPLLMVLVLADAASDGQSVLGCTCLALPAHLPTCPPACPLACRGMLNAEFFSWLPAGASLINLSRGQHVVDADLLAALDSGRLAGAVLDVFHQEPLPPDSPLWHHPKIRAFPHASGITHLPSAADQMARMRALVLAGTPLPPEVVVDRQLGY